MEKKTHVFRVAMTCEGCSGAVERVLNKRKGDGIDNVEINLKDQIVKVESCLPSEIILEILKKTGKSVELLSGPKTIPGGSLF